MKIKDDATLQEVRINLQMTIALPLEVEEEQIGEYIRNGIYAGFSEQMAYVKGSQLCDVLEIREENAIYSPSQEQAFARVQMMQAMLTEALNELQQTLDM